MKRIYYNTEETTTVTRKGYIELDEDFTQIYKSFSKLAPYIHNGTSWKLLIWLLANNNDSNGLLINKKTFEDFRAYLDNYAILISRPTFDRCVNELKQAGIITKVGTGHYYLNPFLFWQDDKQKRMEFITDEKKDGTFISLNPMTINPVIERTKYIPISVKGAIISNSDDGNII